MVKCDLNELEYISEEDAKGHGFFGQYGLYLYMLAYYKDIDEINMTVKQLRYRGYKQFYRDKQGVKEIDISYSGFLAESEDQAKYIFKDTVRILKKTLDAYDEVKAAYPEFDDFICSISKREYALIAYASLPGSLKCKDIKLKALTISEPKQTSFLKKKEPEITGSFAFKKMSFSVGCRPRISYRYPT